MAKPIQILCSWCSSTNVARDAWAEWDVSLQEWVLGPVFDTGWCHRCECERGLEEHELPAGQGHVEALA